MTNDLVNAFEGKNGTDQRLIAESVIEWGLLLLAKNRNYGSSVFKQPILAPDADIDASIRIRMSDKIERLQHLLSGNKDEVGESIKDTISDLGAYCLLWLIEEKKINAH